MVIGGTFEGSGGPLSIATLGDMIDADYWLLVVCDRQTPPCNRTAEVDVQWLADRVGRDFSCLARDLQRIGWRCSKCGCRRVTFRSSGADRTRTFVRSIDDDVPF
jgi:hypothetical protein